MKIGIVSDVHCNQPGLLRALEILGDVDELICLGDSIYEYRFSNEVVQILKDRGRPYDPRQSRGGLSRAAGRPRPPVEWIDHALLQWLAERPKRLELNFNGKKIVAIRT